MTEYDRKLFNAVALLRSWQQKQDKCPHYGDIVTRLEKRVDKILDEMRERMNKGNETLEQQG